ncbi:MAG: ribonuclease R [Thermodesulfovibrio sp.]|nr:ribonuclease R [Thermodesulfovibrio sp.]
MKADLVLEFIKKVGRPVSFKDISEELSLKASERKKLKRVLKDLLSEGKIIRNRKGLYLPIKEVKLITGYFEAHKEGFGFVVPDSPREKDLFIPPYATGGAMHGDRVVVRVEHKRRKEGRIIRIIERSTKRVVGKVEKSGPLFYIQPKKRYLNQQIIIHPDDKKLKVGDLVLGEIVTYQTGQKPLVARVIKVFEKPKNPKDEIEILLYEYDLPKKFSQEALSSAKILLEKGISKAQIKNRRDLRQLPTVTIDGENAKDFDDAVSIKKTKDRYILWVHIADVSHYVKWDSVLDKEAKQRGTSVYLPDRVIPMLPPALSENLCSLLPKTPRLTFTVELHFDNSGERKEAYFYPSLIQTQERMTYTSVKKILIDKDKEEIKKYKDLVEIFEIMAELCELLKDRRKRRGSLDFDLPEPEVLIDLKGDPQAIIKAERNLAHFIIEEFMIATNEAVAEFLYSKGIPSIYRIHEEPEPVKIQHLTKIVRNLGLINKDVKTRDFPEILQLVKGTEYEEIINYLLLRSLKQAKYSPENVGHFGLASEFYTHFTSPIRRYPDLVVHRILKEVLKNGKISKQRQSYLEEILPEIAIHSSKTERQADEVERDAIQIMRVWFMKDKVGEKFDGKVIMVTSEGLRIRLNEYFVEGFLPISHMTDDFYQFDENRYLLFGLKRKRKFTIGTPVKILVSKVNIEEREIIFDLL